MATANKLPYLTYTNSVNLMTVATINSDNKGYLVDKRLVDYLLSKITKGSLEDIKDDLRNIITVASDKETLFAKLDDYLYLDKVIQLLPVEEETADVVQAAETY